MRLIRAGQRNTVPLNNSPLPDSDVIGRRIHGPFFLSAAPSTLSKMGRLFCFCFFGCFPSVFLHFNYLQTSGKTVPSCLGCFHAAHCVASYHSLRGSFLQSFQPHVHLIKSYFRAHHAYLLNAPDAAASSALRLPFSS